MYSLEAVAMTTLLSWSSEAVAIGNESLPIPVGHSVGSKNSRGKNVE